MKGSAHPGTAPSTWHNLPAEGDNNGVLCWPVLQVLDLSHNKLTSTLPPSWAQLGHLSVLNLAYNQLTGALPPAWADQRSLLQLCVVAQLPGQQRIRL